MTASEHRGGYRERQKREIRAKLIDVAHRLVGEEGFEGLTMRRLAALAGCAPMSVYSYFPDKDAILAALAEDALAALAHSIESFTPGDPLEALEDFLLRYVEFGLANPQHYRVVFTPRSPERAARATDMPSLQNPVLRLLVSRLEDCIRAGRLSGDPVAHAGFLWATVHGAVDLLTCFPTLPFEEDGAFARRVVATALASLPRGATEEDAALD
jgi:AcrR family transcriptional regulator